MAVASEKLTKAVAATLTDARSRIERASDWRRRLVEELSELPDTLQKIRNGAADFERVGERLAKSSASLEEIVNLYESTIAESGRRSAQAVDTLRSQIDALAETAGSPERLAATMSDVQRAFETMAELNPLWPRSTRKR
jgi:methyl-accepting chemotaxis protein